MSPVEECLRSFGEAYFRPNSFWTSLSKGKATTSATETDRSICRRDLVESMMFCIDFVLALPSLLKERTMTS